MADVERYWLRIVACASRLMNIILTIIVRVGTFPYYRIFHFNLLGVVQRMAQYEQDSKTSASLRLLRTWRERKLDELQFISIASAVLAGAVIGSFSWFTVQDSIWVSSACWYSSLVFSILGILLSAQQIAILKIVGDIPASDGLGARSALDRYRPLLVESLPAKSSTHSLATTRPVARPKRSMVFVWQCPIMLMSYSACLFLLGLTLLVITPLIRLREHGWSDGANTAVFYLSASGAACIAFVFCSFWVYRQIDFESEIEIDITVQQRQPVWSDPAQTADCNAEAHRKGVQHSSA